MRARIEGNVFGRLRVLQKDTQRSTDKRSYLLCLCTCGKTVSVYRSNLISGTTRSCGCMAREISAALRTRHGCSHLPEYGIWVKMRHRCHNEESVDYSRYGGRGITVCSRWLKSFSNFYEDMGPRPSPLHSIERTDNDRGYTPRNCKWSTVGEQSRNRRSTVLLTCDGKTQCLSDWAKEVGLARKTLAYRLGAGWSARRALYTSVR